MGKITKEEFEANYAKQMPPEKKKDFMLAQIILPCECDEKGCRGWQLKDKALHEFEVANNLI